MNNRYCDTCIHNPTCFHLALCNKYIDCDNSSEMLKCTSKYIEETAPKLRIISERIENCTKTKKHPNGVSLFTDDSKTTCKYIGHIIEELGEVFWELEDI